MSKCPTCRTGDMEPGHTTVTFTKHDRVTVFRNVPASVCDSCGDYLLSLDMTEQLILEATNAEKRGVQIEIVDWQIGA